MQTKFTLFVLVFCMLFCCSGNVAGQSQQSASATTALSVYPNPVHDVLQFTTAEPVASIRLTSMTGQTVRDGSKLVNGNSFRVADLPRGMYILRMKTLAGKSVARRVLLR